MTKISCAIVAVYTVIVFIKRLRKSSSKKETVDLLKKYICFGIVSLPLGLWYSARNYIKFRQPLSYVPDIGRQSELYTGDRSFAERFIYIDLKNLIRSPFCVVEDDYNHLLILSRALCLVSLLLGFRCGYRDCCYIVQLESLYFWH